MGLIPAILRAYIVIINHDHFSGKKQKASKVRWEVVRAIFEKVEVRWGGAGVERRRSTRSTTSHSD